MDDELHVATMVSSLRRGSLNRRLGERIAEGLGSLRGVTVDAIDLRPLPLPLYDADTQRRDGIPEHAHRILERIAAADAVVLVNPEYNGGYPALFKNVVDWVSRLDMLFLQPRYVALAAATPGKGGGRRGIEHVRALLHNVFVTTHPDGFPVPAAHEALGEDGWLDGADELEGQLRSWLTEVVAGARAHRSTSAAAD